jgi:hypothetical protein
MNSITQVLKRQREIIVMAVILLLSVGSNAQTKIGIKTSFTKSLTENVSVMHSSNGLQYTDVVSFEGQSDFLSYGLYYRRDFDFLFLEADILFSSFDRQYSILALDGGEGAGVAEQPGTDNPRIDSQPVSFNQGFRNIDLSLIAGYRLGNFDIGVGPIFHRTISLDSQLAEVEGFRDARKFVDAGFQFKLGYNIGPINLGVKYEDLFLRAGDQFRLDNNRLSLDSPLDALRFEVAIGF